MSYGLPLVSANESPDTTLTTLPRRSLIAAAVLGALSITHAQSETEPLKIGVILPMTGPSA